MSKRSVRTAEEILAGIAMSAEATQARLVTSDPGPTWEQIADQLADAFKFMRKQNGAASFPAVPGMAWYDAVVAYEEKKFPIKYAAPWNETYAEGNMQILYPGRG